ncbi:hypothetical protein VTN96DRAFT_9995 [Rasamsonia emersonii]
MNIAVPKSDLDRINADSIPVPGSQDQYIAGLSVFHELYCLKHLRQYTWPEHYHANQTAEEKRLNRMHTDVSLFTLEWSQGQAVPRADFSYEHTCVDWRALFEWAGKLSIPNEKMASLRHPLFGLAFPDGKGAVLGASEDMSPKVQ